MPQIIPTTEPFFLPGASTGLRRERSLVPTVLTQADEHSAQAVGCLLVHGFTGTPKEMRWMGEYLNKQGFTVLGVRLAGHATHPEDMIRTNYCDWLASVEDGFQLLSGLAKHIYIMGLSMGGALSLTTATYLPVKGLVAMSTPYKIPDDPRLKYTEIISKIIPYMPKSKAAPGVGWFDPQAWQEHIFYPRNPTRSVGQLNKLLAEMHAVLPQVKVPTLLIHSRDDHAVWPESMPAIYRDLGSTDKQMLWIENSGHVITRDAQRKTVFKAAADFVRRLENEPHAP
jgi:carboxylesterase